MNSDERFLAGRVALVTGSTSGIAKGIARSLASKGANLIITGFGEEEVIDKLLDSLKSDYNVQVVYIGGDLANPDDIVSLHAKAVSAFPGGIDILVNDAGFQHVSSIENFPLDVWNKMLAVMLTAPFHLTQLCIKTMKEKGWGRIVNVSSVRGYVASPNKTGYVAAKHGLIGMTKAVAVEVAGSGITCNALCPGCVETPLFVKQAEEIAENQGVSYEEGRNKLLEVQPSKEPVQIQELGETVAFMCSSAANQMTGASMIIDGGWTAT